MKTRALLLVTPALVVLLAGACTTGGGSTGPGATPIPTPSPTLSTTGATPSPTANSTPGQTPGQTPGVSPSFPATTPTPSSRTISSPATVATPTEAARLVLASDAQFRGIQPYDPNLIGQAAWYRVKRIDGGFEVVVRIGWGDCPSGCIDEHTWTYRVTTDGAVRLVGEAGPSVPPDAIGGSGGSTGGGELGVSGNVTSGPTCPVMKNPPDPACADRPVAGAILIVTDDTGREVARGTSGANGAFSIRLAAGHYLLTPQPVQGLMGTAQPVDFTIVADGPGVTFDISYDTGIR